MKIYFYTLTLGILYYAFIKITGISFPCPFFEATGMLCAGCGTTRMFTSLINLDFKSAFYYNPAVFCVLVFWIVISILLFSGKPEFLKKPSVLTVFAITTATILLLFGITRNF